MLTYTPAELRAWADIHLFPPRALRKRLFTLVCGGQLGNVAGATWPVSSPRSDRGIGTMSTNQSPIDQLIEQLIHVL